MLGLEDDPFLFEGMGNFSKNVYPIGSMYGIFTYIHHILPLKTTIHVGKYTSPMDPSWVLNFDPIQDVTSQMCTPRKINIEPENVGLEDDFPFQLLIFRGVTFFFLGKIPNWMLPPGCASFVTSSSSSRTLQTTGRIFFCFRIHGLSNTGIHQPTPSMGLVYLPTFAIHGAYGNVG